MSCILYAIQVKLLQQSASRSVPFTCPLTWYCKFYVQVVSGCCIISNKWKHKHRHFLLKVLQQGKITQNYNIYNEGFSTEYIPLLYKVNGTH